MDKMESLLKESDKIKPAKQGDLVEGKILEIGSNQLYLDLGPIGTGIIYGIELKDGLKTYDKLKIGDKISANVVEEENDQGYIELSLREASLEKAWQILEEKMDKAEPVKTTILEANRGGLIIELNGVTGFLPVSQLSSENYPRVSAGDRNKILNHLREIIGKKLEVKIIGLDQEREKLIVSEKAVQQEEFNQIISKLKIGQEVEGKVTGIADFGIFIKFQINKQDVEGLVHISELAWQRINNPSEIVKVGDKIKAKIISLDNNRVALSIKDLKPDPWAGIEKKYKIGDKTKGGIIKIDNFGAFVELEKNIHGLAHISQFEEGEIDKKLKTGKKYNFKIITINPAEHRMGLECLDNQKQKRRTP